MGLVFYKLHTFAQTCFYLLSSSRKEEQLLGVLEADLETSVSVPDTITGTCVLQWAAFGSTFKEPESCRDITIYNKKYILCSFQFMAPRSCTFALS